MEIILIHFFNLENILPLDTSFCTFCGKSLVPGSNICENCGRIVPKPQIPQADTSQANYNSNSMFSSPPITQDNYTQPGQTPPQPNLNDPRIKRNVVEFVNSRPKLLTFSELREVFLAYLVIYIGFILRRLVVGNIDLNVAIFETIVLILGIFGVWLLIDKIVSYYYNLYPLFKFDPERTIMSMIFAFIFIGFPPGYFRYRIWLKRLPKPDNIMKIQFLTNFLLIIYGYFWFVMLFIHQLPDIFKLFPFIIGISVLIGILPIGNFKLILSWKKSLYFMLLLLTILLVIVSFPFIFPIPS